MSDLLMQDEFRTLLKITAAAMLALWVGVRYYRVVKADEEAYRSQRYIK